MGFRKQASTTGKVTVSDVLEKEIGLTFHYDFAWKVKTFDIPPSLNINIDQTTSNFVPGNRSTHAAIGSENMHIAGSADKMLITLTFCATLKSDFLPIQIIYG